MLKRAVIVTIIFPLIAHAAVAAESSKWSYDVTATYTTTDLKKDAPSAYVYVPTYYGYAPVPVSVNNLTDGNRDTVAVNATLGRTVRDSGNATIKSRITATSLYRDSRVKAIDGTLDSNSDFKALANIEAGFDLSVPFEKSKSSLTAGIGLSHDTTSDANRVNTRLAYTKQVDAIAVGVQAGWSTDFARSSKDTPKDYAGTLFTLEPTVTFIPNDTNQLSAGVIMTTQYSDVVNNKEVDVRRSDNRLTVGATHKIDRKNTLHADVTTGSSSSLGSRVSFGLSHDF